MNEADRNKRNKKRLDELFPKFRVKIAKIILILEGKGFRPRIQSAWRSPEDQRRAYEDGHSKLLYGFHNVTNGDGSPAALAVDLLDDDNPLDPPSSYLLQLAAAAEAQELVTGLRWGLPKALAVAVDDAIADGDWKRKVKLGWDPTHVQPTDVTVAEARRGKRPA